MSNFDEALLSTMHPIQTQKTTMLLNNFILSTTRFLNVFAQSCDDKLSDVASKITEMEVTLSILEAKLNSVPDQDHQPSEAFTKGSKASSSVAVTIATPDTTTTTTTTTENFEPATGSDQTEDQARVPVLSEALVDPNTIKASEHDDYAKFFKMMKMGIPQQAVSNKVAAVGLDPEMLSNPDAMITRGVGGDEQ